MTLRNMLLAATVIALPLSASAQQIDGLYLSAGAGINYLANTKLSTSGGNGHLTAPDLGFSGDASVGFGYGNGLRTEFELLGITNNEKVKVTGFTGKSSSITTGAMINGLYDFNVDAPFTPYLGLGAGYVGVQQRSFRAYTTTGVLNAKDNTLGSFAVQGIAGVAIPVDQNWSITAEYRLLDKLQSRNVNGVYSVLTTVYPTNVKVGSELDHSALIGVRYALNAAPMAMAPMAPAPAAVVAPAPAPARSYLVFFDWDKADLTARAQQIIADAAKNSTRVAATRIDVAGHADKSGTPAYNQTLSLARANNVAAELVRLGVAKSAISISAFGDTKPLVPTAAGVREPQNRRVEIVLH